MYASSIAWPRGPWGGTILTVGMGRKRKVKQVAEPGPDKPVRIGTDLGALLEAAAERPQPPRPGRTSRVPPLQQPPGPVDPERVPLPDPSQPGRPGLPESPESPDSPGSPVPPPDSADLRRLNDAYVGVAPLGRSRRRPGAGRTPRQHAVAPVSARGAEDAQARARLGALVGEGERFAIERDEDGRFCGLRLGAPRTLLRTLRGQKYTVEARLDLHGMRSGEAAVEVTRFVRQRHRDGARYLMIIHGAGTHSEGGVGVLAETTVDELTRGGAAPLVQAFATAHARRGGLGALAVYLR